MSIVRNRKLYVGSYDLSGYLQGMSFDTTVEMEDDTIMADTTRSNAPGLEDFQVQHEGVWAAGTGLPDTVFEAQKGLADVLATLAPVNGDVGSLAYFMRTTRGSYQTGGEVGSLLRFSVSLSASGGLGAVRGNLMANSVISATGDGVALNLGAVGASQVRYAGMHVLSVSGSSPTLDMIIESDTEEAFADSPSTRFTFAQAGAIGSQWLTPVAGAITDTWWRASWTIGGTGSPSFGVVVVLGIQ